jgi:hypothetical protein
MYLHCTCTQGQEGNQEGRSGNYIRPQSLRERYTDGQLNGGPHAQGKIACDVSVVVPNSESESTSLKDLLSHANPSACTGRTSLVPQREVVVNSQWARDKASLGFSLLTLDALHQLEKGVLVLVVVRQNRVINSPARLPRLRHWLRVTKNAKYKELCTQRGLTRTVTHASVPAIFKFKFTTLKRGHGRAVPATSVTALAPTLEESRGIFSAGSSS